MNTLRVAKTKPSHIIHQVEPHLRLCNIPSAFLASTDYSDNTRW